MEVRLTQARHAAGTATTGGCCPWDRVSLVAEEDAFGESRSAGDSESGTIAREFGDPLLCVLCVLPGGGGTSGDSEDCMSKTILQVC